MEFDALTKEPEHLSALAPPSPRIERFRQTILHHLSRYSFFAAVLTYTVVALGAAQHDHLYSLLEVAPVLISFGIAAFATGVPFRMRAGILVFALMLAGLMHVHHVAFLLPNGYIALLFASIIATLLLGIRGGVSVLVASAALIAFCGYQHVTGALHVLDGPKLDPRLPSNWVRVAVVFAAVSSTCIASVGFLVNRLVHEVKAGDRLVRAVADQSEQRITALQKQNELANKLRQSQKMEAIGLLAGGVAHDFNNLLTVILNNAELGRLNAMPMEQAFGDIVAASERAAMLTRQLLAFSRRQVSEHEALNINTAVEQGLSLCRPLLDPQITIRLQQGAQASHSWLARIDIDQIVMNLCVNAAEAMPEGGEITISTGRLIRKGPDGDDMEWVCLDVSDTGEGIPEEEREHVFEPFFTTKHTQHNSGLGLSVVHGLVTQNGGTIELHSELGEGSLFRVCFPLCPPPQAEAEVQEHRLPMGTETLLLVDDDHATRAVLAAQLTYAGYEVLEAADGLSALHRFDERALDVALVISDVMMPIMGGRALCDALMERCPDIPLLLCSGYSGHKISERFLQHPLHGFLAKPFSGQQLLTKVRRILNNAQKNDRQREETRRARPRLAAARRPKTV